MSTTFITGDRMLSPVYPPLVAVEMLRAVAQGDKIATGENDGVEAIVREFGKLAGIDVSVREGDKAAFDARHEALVKDEIPVVMIHVDPHESSVYASLARTTPDDAVRLVTPLDLVS